MLAFLPDKANCFAYLSFGVRAQLLLPPWGPPYSPSVESLREKQGPPKPDLAPNHLGRKNVTSVAFIWDWGGGSEAHSSCELVQGCLLMTSLSMGSTQ